MATSYKLSLDGNPFPCTAVGEERKTTFYEWFQASLEMKGDPTGPCAFFPDNDAGPDFCRLVRRPAGWDLQPAEPGYALVLVQSKFGKNGTFAEAAVTVDPSLMYHQKRAEKPKLIQKYKEDHKAFLELIRNIPVFRILLIANQSHEARQIRLIKHGRKRSQFTNDLQICVSDDMLDAFFGPRSASHLRIVN